MISAPRRRRGVCRGSRGRGGARRCSAPGDGRTGSPRTRTAAEAVELYRLRPRRADMLRYRKSSYVSAEEKKVIHGKHIADYARVVLLQGVVLVSHDSVLLSSTQRPAHSGFRPPALPASGPSSGLLVEGPLSFAHLSVPPYRSFSSAWSGVGLSYLVG